MLVIIQVLALSVKKINITCTLFGKKHTQCQAREKVHPMPSAAKSAPYAKRGKKLSQYQTWEKVRPVPNVESQAREKINWTQSEGKYLPIAKYVWKCTPRWAREKCVNDKYDFLLKMRFLNAYTWCF